MPPPFELIGVPAHTPVVVSVPHAGRDYGVELEARLALPLARAVALEDRHVDLLATGLATAGHLLVVARTPRLLVDLNRAEDDLDQPMLEVARVASARARGGLGVIPTRLAGSELWRTLPDRDELEALLREIHRPYHATLATALAATRARWGHAVLIDLHSMPPLAGPYAAQVVFGDRHGKSASPVAIVAAERAARVTGFRTSHNQPYAGGHIVARHGRPFDDVHAIQIEIDRRCYLDRTQLRPTAARHRVAAMLAQVAERIVDALDRSPPQALAAE